jgi:hypothetical protein
VRADDARVVVAPIRSGGHAQRARGHSSRSASPRLRRDHDSRVDERVHGSTSPCRAPAPWRSSTARAMSERAVLPSRSCPLRAADRPRSEPADAPAGSGSRPGPSASARSCGWPGDEPRAVARSHTRRSMRRPTRKTHRTREPARTRDIARIDLPLRAPARSSWTLAAPRGTVPHGARFCRAHREGSGDQTRAFIFSIPGTYAACTHTGEEVAQQRQARPVTAGTRRRSPPPARAAREAAALLLQAPSPRLSRVCSE